jgi:hypothetical protein
MPKASARLPKRITLVWGHDRLEVDDPIWIAKIVQEMEINSERDTEDVGLRLEEPRSRMSERIDASLQASELLSFYVDPETPPKPTGYQAPENQGPVAAEALRVFLGLELPVALNFTYSWGRSGHRMSAVHTAFTPCRSYSMLDELELCWMFNGYQLYANHQISAAHFRPCSTEVMCHIERRLLSAQWVRWGFDGASNPPARRHWSSNRRTFVLADDGIQQVGREDSDLEPEYDDRENEDDGEDGIPSSQEAI